MSLLAPSIVTIASALRVGDRDVAIEGVVTASTSLLDAIGRRIVAQDSTGAIEVLLPKETGAPGIGARIRAIGTVGTAYGAPRLRATSVERRGSAAVPTPLRIAGPLTSAHTWQLVAISGRVDSVRKRGERWRAEIAIGAQRLVVVGQRGAHIPITALSKGRSAEIVGIVRPAYTNSTDRRPSILPRSAGDVRQAPADSATPGAGVGSNGGDTAADAGATAVASGDGAATAVELVAVGSLVDTVEGFRRSRAMRWPANFDLLLVTLGCLLAMAMAVLELPVLLRLPVGIVAALVLPGYSVSMALFPPGELDALERSALTFSLSFGIIVFVAPFLNLSPGGLTADSIVGAVSAVTLFATAVAWWRRRGRRAAGPPSGTTPLGPSRWRGVGGRWAGVAVGLVVVLVVALLALGIAAPSRTATEFFVLGPDGTAAGLPARVASGTPTTITVGISNHDGSAQPYRIVVELGSKRLAATDAIFVGPGNTWTGMVEFIVPTPGDDQEIKIQLVKGSNTQPYRSLTLQLDAFAPA